MKQASSANIAEGIGWEVTIVALSAFVLVGTALYYLYKFAKPYVNHWFRSGDPVPEPHMYREADCPICL